MRSLSIASTGMLAQQTNVEVISNNIANMNTTGHKRQRVEFQDLLYQNISRRPGTASADNNTIVPSGLQLGVGVRVGAVYRINEQGTLNLTNNTYDIAINGRGYFQVLLPTGETAYTRDGSFILNPQGQLVTQDGYVVQPAVTIPTTATQVSISVTGLVQAFIPGQVQPTQAGQINLATFINESGLESIGGNFFLETPASGQPSVSTPGQVGFGIVRQGYLEVSNVNPVDEVTGLITAQRAYEMNSKVIATSDQMMQTITQLR